MRFLPYIFLLLTCFSAMCGLSYAQEEGIPFTLPAPDQLARVQTAALKTSKGTIIFELYPKLAPWHVANFKYLADKNFYDGIKFHLYRENYILQGGSPDPADPDAGPGYDLPPEFSQKTHLRGTLGMARRPDMMNRTRRSHGSQFHILLTDAAHFDGSFTAFGKVIKGMEVVDQLRAGDAIDDLVVYVKP